MSHIITDFMEGPALEWFWTWLASVEAVPANDNPSEPDPNEGWRG